MLRIEHPQKGDPLRDFGFTKDGINPWWKYYGRNKKYITLDISKPKGKELLYQLLSDADEVACKAFDVIKMKNLYGKKVRGIERSTFVIDAKGILRREWRGVKVPGHAQEVLEFVKTIQKQLVM